ncbi:MAG: VanZ family protein [Acutalibacteraceae bacterium]|nr:VanZ family protein [Acutalibacteraceae bacterium]
MVNKKLIILRVACFTLSLLIMVFIFSMSAQDAETSSNTSGGLIESVIRFFDKGFAELSQIEQEEYVGKFQFIVRKLAHFSVYLALGFTLSAGMQTFVKLRVFVRTLFAFIIGVLYAILDEIHQIFVPGRSCELRDMLIDSTGILIGSLFIMALFLLIKRIKNKAVV